MRARFILIATTSKQRNVFAVFSLLSASIGSNAATIPSIDVREIMKRSLEAGNSNALRSHEYGSSKRVDEKQLEADGSVRSEVVKTYDEVIIDGFMIRKLVSRNGKPLAQAEERREEDRVRRIIESRKHETSSGRARRVAEEEKKRAKQREFNREIFSAFAFRVAAEEQIDGRKNWIIEATPMPGYKPKELRQQVLPHLKGKVWIDQQDYLWTKAEAIAIDQFSVGFGIIARLEQGARLYFDQIRQPDGVWLLRESGIRAIAHVAIVKRIGIEEATTFGNFQKVPAGVEVVEDSAGN
jgi:hypothetical protein